MYINRSIHCVFNLEQFKNQESIVWSAINLPRLISKCEQWLIDNSRPSTGSRKLMQIVMVYDTYVLVGEGRQL